MEGDCFIAVRRSLERKRARWWFGETPKIELDQTSRSVLQTKVFLLELNRGLVEDRLQTQVFCLSLGRVEGVGAFGKKEKKVVLRGGVRAEGEVASFMGV